MQSLESRKSTIWRYVLSVLMVSAVSTALFLGLVGGAK